MSNPQNILAKYRTYSYHHILIACDNEAAAEFIRNSNSINVFRRLTTARAVTIDETTKKLQVDEIDPATGKTKREQVGSFVVILNGMIDSTFVVKDVEWFTATAASTSKADAFTSIAVEGKMTVEEPRGVRFLNELNGACDLLETDSTGVIWMLKTFFVGHNDDGSSSDYITDLRPLEFMMYNVTGTFSEMGGVYEISFTGAANGAARLPQFSRLARQINPRVGDGKLSTIIKDLEKQMNDQSDQNWTCVTDALKRTYDNVDPDELNRFRKVKYALVLDDVYKGDEYKIDTLTDQEKDVALNDNSGGVIKPGKLTTIEPIIRNIMQRSERVLKDRTEGDEDGVKYIFKIHSEITMVGREADNPIPGATPTEDPFIAVVYRIRRHAELTNEIVKRVLAGDQGIPGEDTAITQQKLDENTISFDYIFTGKNTDIIEFDLKMDMGLAFLQTLGSQNNIGNGTYQIAGTEIKPLNVTVINGNENARGNPAADAEGNIKPQILVRSRTPIFPATNVNNVYTKDVRGAYDAVQFHNLLSRHAALESVEATVTIHGNPFLMSQTNRRPSDTNRRGNTSDPNDARRIMSNWETIPALALLNIFMPETNDTPSDREVFNRRRFWYNGYYYIYGIDHKFSDGIFKQDLHLIALPNESLLQDKQENDITECGAQFEDGAEGEAAGPGEGKPRISEAISTNQRGTDVDDPGGA